MALINYEIIETLSLGSNHNYKEIQLVKEDLGDGSYGYGVKVLDSEGYVMLDCYDQGGANQLFDTMKSQVCA